MPHINQAIFSVSIRRIKLLMLNLNEKAASKASAYATTFTQSTHFNLDLNILLLNLNISFIASEEEKDTQFLNAVIQNVFEIPNLKEYINIDNKVILPKDILITLVTLSISHARAIIATHTAGTPLQEMIVPIINPIAATTSLFPESFEAEFPNALSDPEQSL